MWTHSNSTATTFLIKSSIADTNGSSTFAHEEYGAPQFFVTKLLVRHASSSNGAGGTVPPTLQMEPAVREDGPLLLEAQLPAAPAPQPRLEATIWYCDYCEVALCMLRGTVLCGGVGIAVGSVVPVVCLSLGTTSHLSCPPRCVNKTSTRLPETMFVVFNPDNGASSGTTDGGGSSGGESDNASAAGVWEMQKLGQWQRTDDVVAGRTA
jgi:hypothetical protein